MYMNVNYLQDDVVGTFNCNAIVLCIYRKSFIILSTLTAIQITPALIRRNHVNSMAIWSQFVFEQQGCPSAPLNYVHFCRHTIPQVICTLLAVGMYLSSIGKLVNFVQHIICNIISRFFQNEVIAGRWFHVFQFDDIVTITSTCLQSPRVRKILSHHYVSFG